MDLFIIDGCIRLSGNFIHSKNIFMHTFYSLITLFCYLFQIKKVLDAVEIICSQ